MPCWMLDDIMPKNHKFKPTKNVHSFYPLVQSKNLTLCVKVKENGGHIHICTYDVRTHGHFKR